MQIVSLQVERGKQKGEYITVWTFGGGIRGEKETLWPIYAISPSASFFFFVSKLSHKSRNASIKLRVYEFVDCIQLSYVRVV
jgi:hypothetical protein